MSTQVNLWMRLSSGDYADARKVEQLTPELRNVLRDAMFTFLENHDLGGKFVLTQTGPEIVSLL